MKGEKQPSGVVSPGRAKSQRGLEPTAGSPTEVGKEG